MPDFSLVLHINVIYHHYRNKVANGRLRIIGIDTKDQLADSFTKAVDVATFERHCKLLMGW